MRQISDFRLSDGEVGWGVCWEVDRSDRVDNRVVGSAFRRIVADYFVECGIPRIAAES